MALWVFFVLFLALTGHSSAQYCLCKDGVGDDELQKSLDWACGYGADCGPIQPDGPCYEPNTVKDHCSYAVNSYYQRMQSAGGTCDFSGTATTSSTPPSKVHAGCVYPSSPSDAGTSTTPPSTGTPGSGTTPPSSGTPISMSPPTPTSPSTSIPDTPPSTPSTGTTTPGTSNSPMTGSPMVFGTSPPPPHKNSSGSVVSHFGSTITMFLLLQVFHTIWLSLRV